MRHEKEATHVKNRITSAPVVAVSLLLSLALSGCENQVDQPDVEPVTSQAPSDEPSEGAGGEALPDEDGFLIPLDELAALSPAEVTELTTISAESVTSDGEIDWGRYSERLVDVLEFYVNAGSSQVDLEAYYADPSIDPKAEATKYEAPIEAAILVEGAPLTLEGLKADHNNQVNTAYVGYLLGAEPVLTSMELVEHVVLQETETSAVIKMTLRNTDNFFSSGALDPESPRDTAFGRSDDLDETIVQDFTVVVMDGVIRIENIVRG